MIIARDYCNINIMADASRSVNEAPRSIIDYSRATLQNVASLL
jgi:hypothetical protein